MESHEIISMIIWDGISCRVVPQSLVGAHPFGSWLSSCDSLLVLIWVRPIFLLLFFMVAFHRREVMEKETLTKASEGGSLFTSQPNKCMCIWRSNCKKKKKQTKKPSSNISMSFLFPNSQRPNRRNKTNPTMISRIISFAHIFKKQPNNSQNQIPQLKVKFSGTKPKK